MAERSLSPAEISAYARRWREFNRARREHAEPVVRHTERKLPEVARLLVENFGASKVILFGSYARGTAIETSDIDLLVFGIPLSRIVSATYAASKFLGGRRTDLIPAEFVDPAI